MLQGMGDRKIPLCCSTVNVFGHIVSEIPTGNEEECHSKLVFPFCMTAYC